MSVTIPNLPTAESVASTDYVVVETAGGTKKANVSQIKPSMDNAPTSGSSNPVTSDGVYSAVHGTKPLTEGGTGATSASNARTNLGLGDAAVKAVDTSITAASQSANLPTSEAVAAFVEGKGYLTQAPVTSVNGQTGAVNITAVSFHILQVGESLPATGVPGGFYFVPNGKTSGTNLYDEWVDADAQGSWENLGPVEVDLSNYPTTTEMETYVDGKSPTTANVTMAAASWDGTTKVYSFETSYPSTSYNIEAVLPQESATDDQRKALSKADIGGYYSTNIVKAHGTVPEIDIPVTLVIRAK